MEKNKDEFHWDSSREQSDIPTDDNDYQAYLEEHSIIENKARELWKNHYKSDALNEYSWIEGFIQGYFYNK